MFVVNKADRGGVDATVRDLQGMLDARRAPRWSPPIVPTVAIDGERPRRAARRDRAATARHLEASGELARRRELRVRDELRGIVLEWVAKRPMPSAADRASIAWLLESPQGVVDPYTAATELVGQTKIEREG